MTLEVQFIMMISMILGGLYLGFALETYRRLSRHVSHLFFTYSFEIIFWMVQAFILFYILFRVNGGEIRFYNVLAVLLGFSIYKALLAPLYKRGLEKIIVIVKAIYNFLSQTITILIIKPITFIIQLVINCLLLIFKSVLIIFSFLFKVIRAPVVWGFKLIYHLLPQRIQGYLFKLVDFYSILGETFMKWLRFFNRKGR